MIKREGIVVTSTSNNKDKKKDIANDTLEILKNKQYTSLSGKIIDISKELDAAISGTKLYKEFLSPSDELVSDPTIEVTNETTAQAASRLLATGKTNLVALNFASARNPGGGFVAGAQAQEEDLCRCSGLYPCLKSKPSYYNENVLCEDTYYTHNIIYSPNVPFIRDEYLVLLEDPFLLSIISAPAPNVSAMKKVDQSQWVTVMSHRIYDILHIAKDNNHKNIILGAWGCGAFGNDAFNVAQCFLSLLKTYPYFDHVTFAVYDTKPEQTIFNSFKETFHG